MIGLELIEWSPNATNGSVNGVKHFCAREGYGYFAYIDNIVDVVKIYILWKQERLIWIAFYKNMENSKCLLVKLPKDIIKYIITLIGQRIYNKV